MSHDEIRTTVLIVDDNDVDRMQIKRLLGSGCRYIEAATAGDVPARLDEAPSVALVDHRLPDRDGAEVIRGLTERGIPCIMLTGVGNEAVAVMAMKSGAIDYLSKALLGRQSLRLAVRAALERAKLQRRVNFTEARLRALVDQLPALIWSTDAQLRITSLAGRALKAFPDADSLVGASVDALWTTGEQDAQVASEAHHAGLHGQSTQFDASVGEHCFRCRVQPLKVGSSIRGVVGVALDVTETRQLEEGLRRAQQEHVVGRMASSVAHDFNNLLSGIQGMTSMAMSDCGPTGRSDLDAVLQAVQQGQRLVEQLLSRVRGRAQDERASVDAVLGRSVHMLRRLAGKGIDFDFDLGAPGIVARMSTGALEQLVLNLTVNAIDAMQGEGALSLCTAVDPQTEEVVIEVRDTGPGIPDKVLRRVFEPFFTTKADSSGTGLGLATVRRIVDASGGTIDIQTQLGVGTTFSVRVPCEGKLTPEVETRRTILLVESNALQRRMIARVLAADGCKLLTAGDGAEALEAWTGIDGNVDVLVVNTLLPDSSGQSLLRELRRLHPRLKVVLTGGTRPSVIDALTCSVPSPYMPDSIIEALDTLAGLEPERA